ISDVEDPELVRQAGEVLSAKFRSRNLEELSDAVQSQGSLDVILDRAGSVITEDVVVHTIRASRPLLPWVASKEVVLQVDFILEDRGAKVAAGRSYLRFEPTVDNRWRYLGETDFQGFYSNLFRMGG
ncbi:MAG: hypothetical protein PVF91_16210, partial [Chromatiales bacterium]